jgi:hypothetical protein
MEKTMVHRIRELRNNGKSDEEILDILEIEFKQFLEFGFCRRVDMLLDPRYEGGGYWRLAYNNPIINEVTPAGRVNAHGFFTFSVFEHPIQNGDNVWEFGH